MERTAQSKQAKASNSKQKQGKTQRVAQNSAESPRILKNLCQNPPKILSKPLNSNQNRAQKPPRAFFKTCQMQAWKNDAKKLPKRPPKPLNPSQNLPQPLPKWSPRPSQIRFLNNFRACFFLVVNSHRFFAVLWQNLFAFVRVDL